jgi:hypothetical protein
MGQPWCRRGRRFCRLPFETAAGPLIRADHRSTHAGRSLIAGPGRIAGPTGRTGRTGALSFLIGLHVRGFAGPAC